MFNFKPILCFFKKIYLLAITVYIFLYTVFTIKLIFNGLLNNFSMIDGFLGGSNDLIILPEIKLFIFTILGSVLGGSVLNIVSFHKYIANKSFDYSHSWGFVFSPLLSSIIGVMVFSLISSGLFVLTGTRLNVNDSLNSYFTFIAIGGISGYNWDIFIKKLNQLSRHTIELDKKPE